MRRPRGSTAIVKRVLDKHREIGGAEYGLPPRCACRRWDWHNEDHTEHQARAVSAALALARLIDEVTP